MSGRSVYQTVLTGVYGLVFGVLGGGAGDLVAQSGVFDAPMLTGQVIRDIPSRGDPSHSFSLYLPSSYTAARAWPIVFLLDPRGQGMVPLSKLVPAAERLGYVLASSNNTASDGDGDPNTPAINAMIATLQPEITLDDRRFYLVGMSGTARIAWAIGYAAIPHVAGVVGFGAGPPPDMNLEDAQGRHGVPFVFYGGAGDRDFNYAELVLLEGRLRHLGFRYASAYYSGPHGWPQAEGEFSAALSWLHLMAMQRGLLAIDPVWVEAEHLARVTAAREIDRADEPNVAWQAYAAVASDFEGLTDTSEASERAAALAAEPAVMAWRTRRLTLARKHTEYAARAGDWLREAGKRDPDLEMALRALAVDSLQMLAADESDPDGASAAWRALADLYSLSSFYYSRFHVDRRDWEQAALTLEIADSIVPGNAGVCRQLERVLGELGRQPGSGRSAGCAALVNSEPDS